MKFTVAVDFEIVREGDCTAGTVTVLEFTGLVGVPDGGVATTDAVLTTEPLSRSACVTVWLPVHVVDAPGANVVTGQVTPVVLASVTLTAVTVTLPVLVTRNEYGINWPIAVTLARVVDLAIVSVGAWTAGTVTVFDDTGLIGVPEGGVAVTEAVLITLPASRSACVTVCDPVHVVDAPGRRVVAGHEMPVAFGSDTLTDVTVTLPVLVTTNEYGID